MTIYQFHVIPLNTNCIRVKSASKGCPLKHPLPLTFPFLRIALPANPPLACVCPGTTERVCISLSH